MSNLVPKQIVNKNNVTTTVHVRADAAAGSSGRGIPAPGLGNSAKISTGTPDKVTPEPKLGLIDRIMKPFKDRKAAQAAAALRQQQEIVRQQQGAQLSQNIQYYLPAGMNLAPEVKDRMNAGIAKIDSDVIVAVQKHLKRRNGTSLSIMDVLEFSDNPNGELRRITDHFDFAYRKLDWGYPARACEFIVDSLPDEGLTIEQERSVLRLQNSLYEKDLTPAGGSSNKNGYAYNDAATQCAIERPQDIDRIIALAQTRNPLNVADYNALLDSEVAGVLAEGDL